AAGLRFPWPAPATSSARTAWASRPRRRQPETTRRRAPRRTRGSDRRDLFLVGHPERGAAAAGRDHVRVVDLEAGALQALDVVHDRALHVGQRRTIDEDAKTMVLEHLVAFALRIERERVLEAGAATAPDA